MKTRKVARILLRLSADAKFTRKNELDELEDTIEILKLKNSPLYHVLVNVAEKNSNLLEENDEKLLY